MSRGDQTDPGRRETGSQHLYYGRYTEISKKGGRITPAAAALGSMLNLKPVLQLREKS
ncbi:MAG: DegV family protein [[Ruminococcus] lactaris]|uniref:DegV family protein n=1 Tax=[Ruminococcus] lactaris TaxID=46228 RepID=UPI0039996849